MDALEQLFLREVGTGTARDVRNLAARLGSRGDDRDLLRARDAVMGLRGLPRTEG